MIHRFSLAWLWLGTTLLPFSCAASTQPGQTASGPGMLTRAGAGAGTASQAPAHNDPGADMTNRAVVFRVCDDQKRGETGRLIKIEWVGRTEARKVRCE
jgi:hypothetical protein